MEIGTVLRRVARKVFPPKPEKDPFPIDAWEQSEYQAWFDRHRVTEVELAAQRNASFDNGLLFSIIVPLYKTPLEYLHGMVDSVLAQTYGCFELILVNASPEMADLKEAVRQYCNSDSRVVEIQLQENHGIAENTNAGIAAASGDFVCFLDHDDFLEPDCLFRYTQAIDGNQTIDLLYCDEDLVEAVDGRMMHKHPFFKADYSPELMFCKNGIIHFMAIRKSLLKDMPIPDSRFDGAQDYNMVLYASMSARAVHHESRVLYHWRMDQQSTANNPDAKPYAKLASRLAIANNLGEELSNARIIGSGIVNTQNLWFRPSKEKPLVSVIVDCADPPQSLTTFLDLLRQTNSYNSIEVIAVCPDSVIEEGDVSLGEESMVRYVCAEREASRYARFNMGSSVAAGDYLLFMDAGSMFLTAEPLEQMLGFCRRDGIGVVAPKTLFFDGRVRCYGVAVTSERIMPLYRGYPDEFPGYQCNLRSFQNSSAASYLGMMTPRLLFQELRGFDDNFEGEIGAADYCHRVIESGNRIVQTCTVKLQSQDHCPYPHYDNQTNAPEFTDADLHRFDAKWPGVRAAGDPYFNRNLDQSSSYFQVAQS